MWLDKFKKWMAELRSTLMVSHCYTDMEYQGIAVFGMCSGNGSPDCSDCPHFVKVE